jgi:hypothetical protein
LALCVGAASKEINSSVNNIYENKPPKRQDQLAKTGSTRQPINGTDF